MQKMQFSIKIKASKEKVWNTLWEDKTFRDWANIIDEGTYMVGELKQGQEIQFISGNSGYGVTSLVEKIIPNEYLLLSHKADTKESGTQAREDEWTGGKESYTLTEKDSITILTIEADVPDELEEMFKVSYPKALERIKMLAEQKS